MSPILGIKAYEHNPIVTFSRDPSAQKDNIKFTTILWALLTSTLNLKHLRDSLMPCKYVKSVVSFLEKVQNEVAGLDIEEIYSKLIKPNNFDLVKIKVDK